MPQLVLFGYLVPAAIEALLFFLAPRLLAALAVVPLSVARALPLPIRFGAGVAYRVAPGPLLEQLALPVRERLSFEGAPGAIEWRARHAWVRVPRWTWWSRYYAIVRVDFREVDGALACTSRYLPFPSIGLVCGALFGGAFLLTALGEPALFMIGLLVAFTVIVAVVVRRRARDAAERMLDALAARLPQGATSLPTQPESASHEAATDDADVAADERRLRP